MKWAVTNRQDQTVPPAGSEVQGWESRAAGWDVTSVPTASATAAAEMSVGAGVANCSQGNTAPGNSEKL